MSKPYSQPDHTEEVLEMVTDTNQASEDELREKINSALFADDFPILNDIEKDAVDRILAIIRTEKLKLLAELEEYSEVMNSDVVPIYGVPMSVIYTLITKLEAEL